MYHFISILTEVTEANLSNEYSTRIARQGLSIINLAATYLALGDEEKALEYIKHLKTLKIVDYGSVMIPSYWPGFESIRNRPEFLDVLNYLQNTFQEQHKRIESLIEEMELDPFKIT